MSPFSTTSINVWLIIWSLSFAPSCLPLVVDSSSSRGPVKDPSKHDPSSGLSSTDVVVNEVTQSESQTQLSLYTVDRIIERKLNQVESRFEKRLDDRIQLLNQSVTFGHMEKLLHHLNEELLLNRDHLDDQRESLDRVKSQLSDYKQQLDTAKATMFSMNLAIDNLTVLVNQLLLSGSRDGGGLTSSGAGSFRAEKGRGPVGGGGVLDRGINKTLRPTKSSKSVFPIDCQDAYERGEMVGQERFMFAVVQPRTSAEPFKACCFLHHNASWTVIQRRVDGSVDFYRNWVDYKRGFGDLQGEFWLGNDYIYQLTNQGDYSLRVEMVTWEGHTHWAEYRHFRISDEAEKYRLDVASYLGNAGDSLSSPWENDHNGQPFSTHDADHDARHYDNCAEHYRGAWWFKSCFQSHLNGVYYPRGSHSNFFVRNGIQWNSIHPHSSLKDVKMMIRLNDVSSFAPVSASMTPARTADNEFSNGIE